MRPSSKRPWLPLLGSAISLLVALLTGLEMMGRPAHLVHILTLLAAGVAAGAGLARSIESWKAARRSGEGEALR